MHTRIDIIEGQEVEVKVYDPQPIPKSVTVRLRPSRKQRIKKGLRKLKKLK